MRNSGIRLHSLLLVACAFIGALFVPLLPALPQGPAPVSIKPLKINNGKPDLEVRISSSPSSIYGGELDGNAYPSHVTITVYNSLTIANSSISFKNLGNALVLFGSDVNVALVRVYIPAPLTQLGNVRIPQGFTGSFSPDKHTFYCWGGPVPAGGMITIEIDVVGAYTCGEKAILRTTVDPSNWVDEASETNNEATTEIFVWSIC